MPIYEFECRKCETRFEKLCRIQGTDDIACPECGAGDVKKLISGFFSHSSSGGSSSSSSSCGGCRKSSCAGCH